MMDMTEAYNDDNKDKKEIYTKGNSEWIRYMESKSFESVFADIYRLSLENRFLVVNEQTLPFVLYIIQYAPHFESFLRSNSPNCLYNNNANVSFSEMVNSYFYANMIFSYMGSSPTAAFRPLILFKNIFIENIPTKEILTQYKQFEFFLSTIKDQVGAQAFNKISHISTSAIIHEQELFIQKYINRKFNISTIRQNVELIKYDLPESLNVELMTKFCYFIAHYMTRSGYYQSHIRKCFLTILQENLEGAAKQKKMSFSTIYLVKGCTLLLHNGLVKNGLVIFPRIIFPRIFEHHQNRSISNPQHVQDVKRSSNTRTISWHKRERGYKQNQEKLVSYANGLNHSDSAEFISRRKHRFHSKRHASKHNNTANQNHNFILQCLESYVEENSSWKMLSFTYVRHVYFYILMFFMFMYFFER